MENFTVMTAVAAPLYIMNVDTDMLIPKQFLKTIKRSGLGEYLFNEMRYHSSGEENKDFILNKDIYRNSGILISGKNFGCGSSREHAPWALLDFGIRCVIAPSFADIFFNNCFKNGILPIVISESIVEELIDYVNGKKPMITVDLVEQKIIANNNEFKFEIDSFRKKCLVEGLDDISLTLEKKDLISVFEEKDKVIRPWLYKDYLE